MTPRPQLLLQPIHNSTADLLKCFALGLPLSCDQLNFIEWHKELSSAKFDPIYRYYVESVKKKRKINNSFLLSSQNLTPQTVKQFKRRLNLFLAKNPSHVLIGLTQQQFLKFKEVNIQELIFWHGNQFLTDAPFIPGGIPPAIYFQWGNLFGVVKYVVTADEKELKANILIYFEDMQERNLNQCVFDYQNKLKNELDLQQNILYDNKIEPPSFNHFLIKPPMPTLRPY